MFWGITPALDLLEEYDKINNNPLPPTLNILLVGSADSRHIFKTLARRFQTKCVHLNFFIIEACMETVAKQLLLLLTALQSQKSMGLEQKTKVFMELYGNTLIRPYTSKYLTNVANDMVKMITDYNYMKDKISFVNLNIKYKERDYLENLVKFWCSKDEYNIVDIWDRRLRKNLGARYDSKAGAFDWDLHMRMHVVGGKQICNQEYRTFRLNGVAFSWLESEVSRPNRSMVCAIMPNGEKFVHYGYLGDMETGPFIAYGLDCEDKSFLKCTNGQNSYRATDITERNLKQMFYEIEHGKEYEHKKKNDMELGCVVIKQEKIVLDTRASEIANKKINSCQKIDNVTIHFLSMSTLEQMKHKEQYENFFDIVYFANNYVRHLDKDVVKRIIKDERLLIIEHQLFIPSFRKKDLEEYVREVEEKISGIALNKLDFDLEKDSYMKFIVKNKSEDH